MHPVSAYAYIRQLTDRQLPILQQQQPISLRQGRNLSNEYISRNISVEAKKPIIIANSTVPITTHLSPHILLPAMSPAAEEELTCRNPSKPNGISTLRTTFCRAMRRMCPKMDSSPTSLRASTTNTGSCEPPSILLLRKAVVGFHHYQAYKKARSQRTPTSVVSQISTSSRPPIWTACLNPRSFYFGPGYLSLRLTIHFI